jgi:hypothetical protein
MPKSKSFGTPAAVIRIFDAMNNQILVRVVNCAAHHLEQLEPRPDIELRQDLRL